MTSTPSHLPKPADGFAIAALAFAALCVAAAIGTASLVRASVTNLGHASATHEIFYWGGIALTILLFWPAIKGFLLARSAAAARAKNDAVETRIATAASRDKSSLTFGWGVFVLLVLGFIAFVFMNNTAVGDTFFRPKLLIDKWPQVIAKFMTVNIFIFVVAELLVLVWGLFVAMARMMPGPAGRPIRFLATLYIDVFRGLPAIVTLYLIGFGIPTSGLPQLVYSQFVDTQGMTAGELRVAARIPEVWWCILAITLTYGAYVAEVYRSGIESIHWSQVSAARSLGLSYYQTMRYVVVPQAVRRVVAPLLNDFIGLQKDTALVQVLGVVDAFNGSRGIAAQAFNLSAVTIVAIIFVLVTIPQARLVDHMIEKDAKRMKAGGA